MPYKFLLSTRLVKSRQIGTCLSRSCTVGKVVIVSGMKVADKSVAKVCA